MRSQTPANTDGHRRRRLSNAELTPEQRAAVEARRAQPPDSPVSGRAGPRHRSLSTGIPACRRSGIDRGLGGPARERERQGLSLTDMAELTGIDRATISKLETGKIANPTIGTLRTYAKALGRRLAWTLEVIAKPDIASQ